MTQNILLHSSQIV